MADQEKQAPTLEALRIHREEIMALARKYGAYNVRVFGSVARGDARADSDIDFLVDFKPGTSIYEISGFWQDLRDLLGHNIDVVEDHAGLRERFRRRVLKDAVLL